MIDVRGRLTDRVNVARLRLEGARARRPLIVVLLAAAVGLAGAAFIASKVSRTTLASTFHTRFAVSDMSGVVAGVSQVRVRGIPAGTITKVGLDEGQPVLDADIQSQFGRVYRDARATLRPNTALQDMYLDVLDSGTPQAGRLTSAQPLPATRTETAVAVPDVLNVFRGDQRAAMVQLLDNFGNGLHDRGARLRAAFVELVPLLDIAGRTAHQIAVRQRASKLLIHNAALLTSELGRRDRELKELVSSGSLVLEPFLTGRADFNAVLRDLPPTLSQVDTTFTAVRGVLGKVDHALVTLGPVAGQLPSALSALRGLNTKAAPAVRALQQPVHKLVPFAQALAPLARNLSETIAALTPQTGAITKVTTDLAQCKRAITGFFQWNTSLSKFGDARGPVPRGNLAAGTQSTGTVGSPDEYAPAACTPGQPIGGRLATEADRH